MADIKFLDDRFYGSRNQSIFAQAKAELPEAVNAATAYQAFGHYEPVVEPLFSSINGIQVDTGTKGIFFTDKKGHYQMVGSIKGRYQMVTPSKVVEMWDNHVSQPVVAMGAAGKVGETFFLSSEFGEMEIKGDLCKVYLLCTSPMTGQGALTVRITPVRLACTNMMMAARRRAVMTARIGHTGKVIESTEAWMKHLVDNAEGQQKLLQRDFEKMAETPLTEELVSRFEELVYELPKQPVLVGPSDVVARREHEYNMHLSMANHRRRAFRELMSGGMTGGDDLENTLYKAYQAHAELTEYRRGKEDAERAEDALFGKRGEEIELGYNVALALAGK